MIIDLRRLTRGRVIALLLHRLVPIVAPGRAGFQVWDDTDHLGSAPPFLVDWPTGVARPRIGLVQDIDSHPYWTKYRRFLLANSFPFKLVDIHAASWLDQLVDIDLLVWRPSSQLFELEEARKKIFFLHDFLSLRSLPNLRAMNLYEEKVLQSWVLGAMEADTPETVVSYNEEDAKERITGLGPEIVWKLSTGSSSYGVERMSARRARRAAHKVFSASGRVTYWPYAKQKGYVYAQRLERDLRVDARVLVVGPLLLGYYRDAPEGDFRASGMGRVRKEGMPAALLEEAWSLAKKLDVGAVAIDFIISPDGGRHKVIEFSSFIEVETSEQLLVDGQAGVYVRISPEEFEFCPGRFWPQELALAAALGEMAGVDVDRLLTVSVDNCR